MPTNQAKFDGLKQLLSGLGLSIDTTNTEGFGKKLDQVFQRSGRWCSGLFVVIHCCQCVGGDTASDAKLCSLFSHLCNIVVNCIGVNVLF